MRRWLLTNLHRILCVLAIAVVLGGCQSPGLNPPSSSNLLPSTAQLDPNIETDEVKLHGTILFWIDEFIHLDEVQRTVERYQQIQPDVRIVFERVAR